MKHIRLIASGAAAAVILIGGVAFAQSAAFSSEMGVGAQGIEVTSLQTWLLNNGYYSGPITSYFGPLTMAGVERFQGASGITATGYVGPLTLAALNAKTSGSAGVSTNSSTLAQLQAELASLLAQIQALESNTTTGVPAATAATVQTNSNVSVGATLGATGTGPFTYTISSSPLNGTITSFNSSTGAFTYTPKNNYTGADTFSYTVANASGTSAPMTITVNVQSSTASGTPTGQALSFSTTGGGAYNGTLSASGTGPYTYSISENPTHGTITNFNPSNGTFTYIPNANYTGSDTFAYTVSNSAGVSSPITVTVNNGTTAGAPTGQALSFSTTGGGAYNGTLSATGNSPYTYTITSSPSHGTISNLNPSNGTFTYIPNANYTGSDTFTYTVSNSAGVSSPVTVTVNNGTTTGAPTGQTLSFSAPSGVAINGTLMASGAGPYTYAITANPTHGTISSFSPSVGSFSYIPNGGYTGTDSFQYTVSNSSGTSPAYTVDLTE